MIYLFLADGFEEVEAVTTIDYLRRAGIIVTTVGIGGKSIRGTHDITVCADIDEQQVKFNDELMGIILPGGIPGTPNLEQSETVQSAIDFCVANNRLVAGNLAPLRGFWDIKICFTAWTPPATQALKASATAANIRKQRPVCCAKNFITGMSAGCATQFAAKIIEYFKGEAVAQNVLADVVWKL